MLAILRILSSPQTAVVLAHVVNDNSNLLTCLGLGLRGMLKRMQKWVVEGITHYWEGSKQLGQNVLLSATLKNSLTQKPRLRTLLVQSGS